MAEPFQQFLWWMVTAPHFIWRIPAVILAALLAWALWMWLWDVFWPWARLILKILGKLFGKIADALEIIPRKSKAAVRYLEHVLRVCEGFDCPHHRAEAERK